ncbi:rod shape-determining protein MreD [Orrella dioscoreae]|uniref:rod shape-determining protein MreD n=1 Tax=Orrella dioscoreae TaxID=1851544 RepID=UPI0008343851
MEPDTLVRPARGMFVWGTVLFVWLISLLPWRLWPAAPDLLLLVLAFWCAHEPRRVGMMAAFVFGLLMDVHDARLLGEHALIYTLVAYGTIVLHRRLQRFDLFAQALHMMPVFVVAQLFGLALHAWLTGAWPGWHWTLGPAVTAALWPVVGWLLQLPQRHSEDTEASKG